MIKTDYFYKNDTALYNCVKLPKIVMHGERYNGISLHAKVMFGFMLDRLSLVKENQWYDNEGRVYIVYPVPSIMEELHFTKGKVLSGLNELEKVNLIKREKRGKGRADAIYVMNYASKNIRF